MARYVRDFPLSAAPEQVYGAVRQYLMTEGYSETTLNGENVLKKGDGWVTGPTCFKFTFFEGFVRMETWMFYAILPGVYGSELGLEGFVGCAAKGPWKQRVRQVEQILAPMPYYGMGAIPAYTQQAAGAVTNAWNQAAAQAQTPAGNAQAAVKPRFCANCGAPVGEGAFCGNCGNKLQ